MVIIVRTIFKRNILHETIMKRTQILRMLRVLVLVGESRSRRWVKLSKVRQTREDTMYEGRGTRGHVCLSHTTNVSPYNSIGTHNLDKRYTKIDKLYASAPGELMPPAHNIQNYIVSLIRKITVHNYREACVTAQAMWKLNPVMKVII